MSNCYACVCVSTCCKIYTLVSSNKQGYYSAPVKGSRASSSTKLDEGIHQQPLNVMFILSPSPQLMMIEGVTHLCQLQENILKHLVLGGVARLHQLQENIIVLGGVVRLRQLQENFLEHLVLLNLVEVQVMTTQPPPTFCPLRCKQVINFTTNASWDFVLLGYPSPSEMFLQN